MGVVKFLSSRRRSPMVLAVILLFATTVLAGLYAALSASTSNASAPTAAVTVPSTDPRPPDRPARPTPSVVSKDVGPWSLRETTVTSLRLRHAFAAPPPVRCRFQTDLGPRSIDGDLGGLRFPSAEPPAHLVPHVGPWCNGSTLGFGPSSPSSNLGGPVLVDPRRVRHASPGGRVLVHGMTNSLGRTA